MASPIQTALTRIDVLGGVSDSPDYLVRTFLSPANRRAAGLVMEWMREAGLSASHSVDGTVRGILPGSNPDARPLLLGSHLDSVIDAGKYDGPLGIISAIAALELLKTEGFVLPYPVHVLGFSDEEGIRFQTTYLGSRGIMGRLDSATLSRTDRQGSSLAFTLATEGWNDDADDIHYEPGSVRGYVELHIEQGPVLEHAGEPACVVSSIAGQSRIHVEITGRAGHAGTTPMTLRQDALAAAAECVLATEAIARENTPLVATVGSFDIHPGASNSVPGTARFSIDLRHPEDAPRAAHLAALRETCERIAAERGLALTWTLVQENDAVPCDPFLSGRLVSSLESLTGSSRSIPSGAGHDGVALSRIAPIGMLFIRCRGGLSHHPDEHVSPEDVATGIEVLAHFLKTLPSP